MNVIIILSLISIFIYGTTTARYLLIDVDDEGNETKIGKHTLKNHRFIQFFDFFKLSYNFTLKQIILHFFNRSRNEGKASTSIWDECKRLVSILDFNYFKTRFRMASKACAANVYDELTAL